MQHFHGLSWQAKIHGNHAELETAAALKENHRVLVGNCKETAQLLLRRCIDAFVFRRAVAHFHDGHAAAAPVEQLLADAFKYRQGQGGGARVEIEKTFSGWDRSGGPTHGNLILSNGFTRARAGGAASVALQNSRSPQ